MIDLETARPFFSSAPFMVDLGSVPTAVSEGRCETEMALLPRHLQHTGQCHAGVVTSLADHTAGAAAQTLVPGDGVVIKPGRALIFAESEVFAVTGEQRTLVAKPSATLAVVQPRT